MHLDLNKVIISRCHLFRGLLEPSANGSEVVKFLKIEEAHQILVSAPTHNPHHVTVHILKDTYWCDFLLFTRKHEKVAIVDNLCPEVYLTGDSIIAQGEMGREMFFLVKGLVDVVKFTDFSDDADTESKQENNEESQENKVVYDDPLGKQTLEQKSTKIVTLGSGAYFGELALLKDPKVCQYFFTSLNTIFFHFSQHLCTACTIEESSPFSTCFF